MLKFLASMLALSLIVVGCTGGNENTTEPVANDETPPPIPDMPGVSGESNAKPAGAGEAGSAELPATEKSQPNVVAAGITSKSGIAVPGAVKSGALNVRSGPGMKHGVVRVIQKGEKVTLSNCGAVWCQIGENEFVAKKFIAE